MIMVFRFLEIDWSALMEQGQAFWTAVAILGGNTVVNIFNFFKTTVSGKKFSKVSDFAVVADQSIKFAKKEMSDLKTQAVDLIKSDVVAPLVAEIKALKEDNQKLTDLAVTALSLSPIPLEQKKALLPVLATIGTVSKEATVILQANIDKQENDLLQNAETDNTLNTEISKI